MSERYDFFISYVAEDKAWAEWVAWQLEEAGYATVLFPRDLHAGDTYMKKISRALLSCDRLILVVSPAFLASSWVKADLRFFGSPDTDSVKARLVPMKVEECSPGEPLTTIQWVDLVGLDEDSARKALLQTIGPKRAKPTRLPPYPGVDSRPSSQLQVSVELPTVWQVPLSQDPDFMGRERELNAIRREFEKPHAVVVLVGLPGVGKTAIASQYAYRCASDYSVVWWLRATDAETLNKDYSALASALGSEAATSSDLLTCAKKVHAILSHQKNWLLIYDETENPDELEKLLPRTPVGHVLITSRTMPMGTFASVVAIESLPRSVGTELVVRLSQQGDRTAAGKISELSSGMPLLLRLAGSYVRANKTPLSDYAELLESGFSGFEQPLESLGASIRRSIDAIGPRATALLRLCSLLSNDAIPFELLRDAVKRVPELSSLGDHPDELTRELAKLERLSLIRLDSESATTHPLIQEVGRDQFSDETGQQSAEAIIKALHSIFPENPREPSAWSACSRLVPHVIAATGFSESLGVARTPAADLLLRAGIFLHERVDFSKAASVLEQALRIVREIDKNGRHLFSNVSIQLSRTYESLARMTDAIEILEKACQTNPQDPTILVRLGRMYAVLGSMGQALPLLNRVEELVPDDVEMLVSLGQSLEQIGLLERAESIMRRALTIDPKDPIAIVRLTAFLWEKEDYDGARELVDEALRDCRAIGATDPRMIPLLVQCGIIRRAEYRLDDAKGVLYEALDRSRAAYGETHPLVADILIELGSVNYRSQNLAEAFEMQERARGIYEAIFGPNHPLVASALSFLADDLLALGSFEGALENFLKALEIYRSAYGDSHLQTLEILAKIARTHYLMGNRTGAKNAVTEALRLIQSSHMAEHPRVATLFSNIGSLLNDIGQHDPAIDLFRRALAGFTSAYGEDHSAVATTLRNLGNGLAWNGKLSEAEVVYKRYIAILQRFYGSDHPEAFKQIRDVAKDLRRCGYTEKASEYTKWADELEMAYYNSLPFDWDDSHVTREKVRVTRHVGIVNGEKSVPLTEVFLDCGLPAYTYVEPKCYKSVKADLLTPGKHILIQGPSGTGKTCLIQKMLKELDWEVNRDFRLINCHLGTGYENELESAIRQARNEKGSPTILTIVDDFHLADNRLKMEFRNHLKIISDLASWHKNTPKFVLIGIPTSGESLLREATDLGSRMGIYPVDQVKEEDLKSLIHNGAETLNIRFDSPELIVAESNGHVQLCQKLCRQICIQAGIHASQERLTPVRVEIFEAKSALLETLSNQFMHIACSFAKGLSWRLRGHKMYLQVLLALKQARQIVVTAEKIKSFLPESCREAFPLVLDRIPEVICRDSERDHRRYIFVDPKMETFVLDDFLFRYFLWNQEDAALIQKLGLTAESLEKCHEFPFEVGFSFTAKARPLAQRVNELLKAEDIITWFDSDRQKYLLGRNLEGHLREVYSKKC